MNTFCQSLPGVLANARNKRIFDVGCGNGSVANFLHDAGWDVTGVDPSVEGIAHAHTT